MCYICARTSHWNSDYLGSVYSRIDCLNFSASGNEIIRELEGQIRVGNNIDGRRTLGDHLCYHWNLHDHLLVIGGFCCWFLVYVWLMGSLERPCISKGLDCSFDCHDHSTCNTIF